MTIAEEGGYITHISLNDFCGDGYNFRQTVVLENAFKEICQYLNGKRKSFDIPFKFDCGTVFQRKVWNALTQIPYGETRSYSDIAAAIGSPKAVRAVGSAAGKNPILIVVPCHRMIGKDGSMTGFGCGIEIKKKLLNIEK